jgi:NAD(P)-dependent dehydrogenase (short-subunit alcohol dehydrogenase family)
MTLHGTASRDSEELPPNGLVVYVAVSGLSLGDEIARGLEAQGARVVLITDREAGNFQSREAVSAAFAKAQAQAGTPDLVVHAAAPAALRQPAALARMDLSEFHAADAALRATLYTFQAAHGQMAQGGGAIVVVGPSLSLVGARLLVPLCTATEGQRSLVKSAARQWGRLGITVNWVGTANAIYADELAGQGPEVPELGPPPCALGSAPALASGVAPVLAFLGSRAGRNVTGASINLDGGDWMTP